MTSGQSLVKGGVVSPVQLVDDHLPDWVGPGGAFLGVTVTLVRHPVVEGVGPDWHTGERGRDGGIVNKELVGHHLELLVTTNSQVWSPHADHGTISDVGEPLGDQTSPGHLGQPVVVASFAPVVGVVLVGDGEYGDLMTFPVELLDGGVVGVSVGGEECALNLTAVGILSLAIENVLIKIDVVRVDGSIECDGDHLRNLVRVYIAGDPRSVWRTEAVRQLTLSEVTVWSSVGILDKTMLGIDRSAVSSVYLVNIAGIFVRPVLAVHLFITEETLRETLTITALKLPIRTDGLVSLEIWQRLPGL